MPIPTQAIELIEEMFPDEAGVLQLFQLVFSVQSYTRSTALKLVNASLAREIKDWRSRCAAALLLEHDLLRLSPKNLNEHKFVLRRLGIRLGPGHAREELLKQGYTQTELKGFVAQLRHRLARLEYLHNAVARPDASRHDWADFLALTSQEARLTLARYCFTAQEITARICQHVEVSSGVKDVR